MLTPAQTEELPIELEKQFRDLEHRVMSDVVRRLKLNGNDITRSADWQINRLIELGKSQEEIKQYLSDVLKMSDREIDKAYQKVIDEGYAQNEEIYKQADKDFIPYKDNQELQQLVSATKEQTQGEFKNITQSLGFAKKDAVGNIKFQPIADYYQKTLDSAMLDIATGMFSYNTVLNRVVTEMTNSGLRTVDYASGWSNRVDVAARRAIMTGITQVTAKVNEDTAKDLGTNTFEVSYHSGARPSHAEWQGGIYTKEELESVCGLGDGAGLCGWNCYHSYSPFIPGISEPTYSSKELARMKAEDAKPVDYYGKKYTKYEALQKQRTLETRMRAQREKIKLLQEGGADEDSIITARARYRVTSSQYAQFSKAMNLPQQRDRIYQDGKGGIGKGKYTTNITKTVAKSQKSGIINSARSDKSSVEIVIDKFTPCLENAQTGEIVKTKFSNASKKELKQLKNWKFNWTASDLKETEIFKLQANNSDEIQGLIALTKFERDKAIYVNIAESAPHNFGKNKKFNGVGGHLFAIAVQRSKELGYGGFVFMDAKNMELVKHYQDTLGAKLLGIPHPYRMFIDEEAGERLLNIYNFSKEEL